MKFLYPEINYIFDTDNGKINTLIIENQLLMYRLLSDINKQLEGKDGHAVLSHNDRELTISKNLELLSSFIPFELGKKNLLSKLCSFMEKDLQESNYEKTQALLSEIEAFFLDEICVMPGDIIFSKINIGSIIKSIGVQFEEDYDSLGEKIIDYMELVREYEQEKLFVFLNLRSFINDDEMKRFIDTVLRHGYHILLVESSEYPVLEYEKRYIIDKDLCEIS